jgi:hypothetical protein
MRARLTLPQTGKSRVIGPFRSVSNAQNRNELVVAMGCVSRGRKETTVVQSSDVSSRANHLPTGAMLVGSMSCLQMFDYISLQALPMQQVRTQWTGHGQAWLRTLIVKELARDQLAFLNIPELIQATNKDVAGNDMDLLHYCKSVHV